MKFALIAKHRLIWPVAWLREALGVSRSGFHAWLNRSPSEHARYDEVLLDRICDGQRPGDDEGQGQELLANPEVHAALFGRRQVAMRPI